ncbi:MAG TPA: putative porin, partial [candidate division Zixibacteria bacterium]|nr:putative porin [candidate division Zixibacteria bacterium]
MSNYKFTALTALILLLLTSGPVWANGSWVDQTKIKGDVRYRHEYSDQEGKLANNRQRLRARVGIESQIHTDVKLTVQLASGSDDPVSTNQTLDDGFSTKSVGIDLAYFSWTPSKAPGFSVTGGKIKNPFFQPGGTELIWDGDMNPEG